jgi:hypothetical protein
MSRTRSDSFDFRRWRLLVARHWLENRRKYLLFLLAYAGILTAWYAYLMLLNSKAVLGGDIQFPTYFLGLYLAGCLYANTLFADLSSRQDAIHFLALPASRLEKLMTAILFGAIIFFLAYTAVFYLVDIPMMYLSNRLLAMHPQYFPNSSVLIPQCTVYNILSGEDGPLPEKDYHLFLLGFFTVQAIFMLGTIYFKQYALIKSIIATLVLISLGVLLNERIINSFLPSGWHTHLLSWIRYDENELPSGAVWLPVWLETLFLGVFQYGIPAFIWYITYHRLKEKQI